MDALAELARARALVAAYEPRDAAQARVRARILTFVDAHPDALVRTCFAGHVTASVLLLDHARERVLLHRHRKLGRWLQLGGHCDGDGDLVRCAWRETVEESGIEPAWLAPAPLDLDVHAIPARPGEPEHEHHDVRFLAVAPAGARPRVSDESEDVRWFTRTEAEALDSDASVRRLVGLALSSETGP